MLDNLILGALVMGGMNALYGSIAVRRVAHLEQKLDTRRSALLIHGFALALVVVAIVMRARHAPKLPGDGDLAQVRPHWIEWREHEQAGALAVASVPFLLVILLPTVLHVVRALQGFVMMHRADLLARDQAAAWEGAQRAPEPAAKS